MNLINKENIMIVGLGMIGGSYAKALKRLDFKISAIDIKESSIKYALENGIIDEGFTDNFETALSNADVVIFALYPTVFKEWIAENQKYLKPGAILTDVTGVKSCIVYDVQNILRDDVEFIAAHPMAGREVYGVQNSDERIFRDANFIVVPTEKNSPEAIEWCKALGKLLGFVNVAVLSPEEHDKMIGFVSQLTHCIAVALMTCSDNRHLSSYTADSFRDLTRIANINDVMWSELFMLNKDALLEEMDKFMGEFAELRKMLADGDRHGLQEKMKLSSERRSYFNKK